MTNTQALLLLILATALLLWWALPKWDRRTRPVCALCRNCAAYAFHGDLLCSGCYWREKDAIAALERERRGCLELEQMVGCRESD